MSGATSGATSGAATGATVGTAISPGVGSLLGAAAGGLLGLAADTWSSDRSREKDQEDYQANQLQNFMYGQQAQRNAASNEVAGLMKAGLNPALAGGANAAPMVGAPMQNKEAPKFNPGMAQLLSGIRLQNAQTENLEAQAESTRIDNLNKKQRDTAYSVIMDQELDHLRTLYAGDEKAQEIIDMYKALPKSEGTYNAYERTLSMLPKTFGSRADMLAEHLREKVNTARDISSDPKSKSGADWIDNPFLKSLVTADTAETDRTIADIAKLYADTDNIKETLDLIKKQKDLTTQEIERVKALANQVRNSDIKTMIDKGDYTGALFSLLTGLIMGLGNYK